MKYYNDLLERIRLTNANLDLDVIERAFKMAYKAHEGVLRVDTQEYITHPVEVAKILLDFKPDTCMIASALLHDTIEDTNITKEDIESEFGSEIANIVEGLTKISKVEMIWFERQVSSLRKMFISMAQDIRVVFIKLADRLHNMQTIKKMSRDKQIRISQETLEIYAPIAVRLWIYKIKIPLESLAFQILYENEYNSINKQLARYDKSYIEWIIKLIETNLKNENIQEFRLSGRIKDEYSIYKKMKRKNEDNIDNIYDVFAIRIIVPTVEECYRVLGVIHKYWTPIQNRFKDYISIPKVNKYKSLHTTVTWIWKLIKWEFKPVEIQIRTQQMHIEAELWAASHWSYKEWETQWVDPKYLDFIKTLSEIEKNIEDHSEFLNQIQRDILHKRIFVLTPKWEILDLPAWATSLDFAFSIHSDVWLRCIWAQVNNKQVGLDNQLENWDVVRIITRKDANPSPSWLSITKTSWAKQKIRRWLDLQNSEESLRQWKKLFNEVLAKFWRKLLDSNLSIFRNYWGSILTIKERERKVQEIWSWKLSPLFALKNTVFPIKEKATYEPKPEIITNKEPESKPVRIEWDLNENVAIAKNCCNPSTVDKIVWYVTRWGKISVHKVDCSFIVWADIKRLLRASWDWDQAYLTWCITINFGQGKIINKIIALFEDNDFEIKAISCEKDIVHRYKLKIKVGFIDLAILSAILEKLKSIKGVKDTTLVRLSN